MYFRFYLRLKIIVCVVAVLFLSSKSIAQYNFTKTVSDYFSSWDSRVKYAQDTQPNWISPLATASARLGQNFRFDLNRQYLSNGSVVNVYGSGRGLQLIPAHNVEIDFPLPAYQVRQGVKPASGLNDWPGILIKYRILSSTKKNENYVISILAQYGVPTGALVYTNQNHVFKPTLAAGKAWGNLVIQAALAESIPLNDHSNSGISVISNLAIQYHVSELFWPEIEFNKTDWVRGNRANRSQTFLTTGIVIGKIVLNKRSKFTVGLGYQTAVSQYYAQTPSTPLFNHNWILSTRTTF